MLPDELLKKIRLIEIATRKAVNDVLSGQYRSHFKGQGMQFSEHRLYVPGDDIRHINWNASAKSREPLIKKYDEERELTVFLVVDVSSSQYFGTSKKLKSEVAAEIAGTLAYAASYTGDRIGVLLFSGQIETLISPKKGRPQVRRVIQEILTAKARVDGTDLAGALDTADRAMKHNGVVFILSDFIAKNYELSLKRLSRRHDVVVISIQDERELNLPDLGYLLFVDPEAKSEERWVDTSSYLFKTWFKEHSKKWLEETQRIFKSSGVDVLTLLTKEDYAEAVVRFFRARARNKSKKS